jgi:hypothetical protein
MVQTSVTQWKLPPQKFMMCQRYSSVLFDNHFLSISLNISYIFRSPTSLVPTKSQSRILNSQLFSNLTAISFSIVILSSRLSTILQPLNYPHSYEILSSVHWNWNRTWEELRQLMCERSTGPSHVDVGGGAAQIADDWIRTSVWILEELMGGSRRG